MTKVSNQRREEVRRMTKEEKIKLDNLFLITEGMVKSLHGIAVACAEEGKPGGETFAETMQEVLDLVEKVKQFELA